MKSGDMTVIEFIEAKFYRVFLLIDKYKYIEIILSQIENKYLNIDYSQL